MQHQVPRAAAHRTIVRAWTLGTGALLAVALFAPRAAAQERLHFDVLGDEQLAETTLRYKGKPVEPWRARIFAAGGASTTDGAWNRASAPNAAFGLGVGAWSDPTQFVQLRSETFAPDTSALANGASWRALEGYHRLRANLGFGDLSPGNVGADVELGASLAHTTPASTSFLRSDVGSARPFWEARADATLWPRISQEKDSAVVMPVTFGLRRLGFSDDATIGFTSERFSTGVGVRDYSDETASGWIEALGGSYERAAFATRGFSTFSGAEKGEIRTMHFDKWITSPESDMPLIDVTTSLGGVWVADAASKQQTGTVAARFGMSMRMLTGGSDDHDFVQLGFAGARDAGWLADGTGLARTWRIEVPFEISLYDGRAGGTARFVAEYLDVQVGASPSARDGWRQTFADDWYFAPVRGLEVGAYETATDACTGGTAWCYAFGAFVRLTGEWAEQRPDPDAHDDGVKEAAPPPPEPPPATP